MYAKIHYGRALYVAWNAALDDLVVIRREYSLLKIKNVKREKDFSFIFGWKKETKIKIAKNPFAIKNLFYSTFSIAEKADIYIVKNFAGAVIEYTSKIFVEIEVQLSFSRDVATRVQLSAFLNGIQREQRWAYKETRPPDLPTAARQEIIYELSN